MVPSLHWFQATAHEGGEEPAQADVRPSASEKYGSPEQPLWLHSTHCEMDMYVEDQLMLPANVSMVNETKVTCTR